MSSHWTELLIGKDPHEGDVFELPGGRYVYRDGMLRQEALYSESQAQTRDSFEYKWSRTETYESETVKERSRNWLLQRYCGGDTERLDRYVPEGSHVLDAGCGAGYSAALLLGERMDAVRYLGVDISRAVDVARDRFEEFGLKAEFLQASFMELPFEEPRFDAILAEGTLHHTDSTRDALRRLTEVLVPGGHVLFYVYRKKGPIREFVDDHVREHLADMDDDRAWEALLPLTRLGASLGEMDVTVRVPEDIPYLQIEAGEYDLQRFIYWNVMKVFYRRELSVQEMNKTNFDWYRPLNAHRHSEEEVRSWCDRFGLEIEHMNGQRSGITVVARKQN